MLVRSLLVLLAAGNLLAACSGVPGQVAPVL